MLPPSINVRLNVVELAKVLRKFHMRLIGEPGVATDDNTKLFILSMLYG
jgi:hypothetical protein